MKITCISDLHGCKPKLPGGDLLIIAGDLTACDTKDEYIMFADWVAQQKYEKKIIIAGNHDTYLEDCESEDPFYNAGAEYLCDSGTEYKDMKIYGTPWTKRFFGQNPKCMAFTYKSEYDLKIKFDMIPHDTNILITHSPPFGTMDKTWKDRVGSNSLKDKIKDLKHLRLHVFGHIHEGYGQLQRTDEKHISVNASHMNPNYEPDNEPIEIIL